MILIYSPTSNQKQIDNTIEILKGQLSVFFITDDDLIFTTETNPKLIRDIIPNHKVGLFYTHHSINEMGFSLTELVELIFYLLKNDCDFQSESDDLYLSTDNIDDFNITVTDVFLSN